MEGEADERKIVYSVYGLGESENSVGRLGAGSILGITGIDRILNI